jgi:5-methylthioadenosine/S-adenosylhomocysteine deaminase
LIYAGKGTDTSIVMVDGEIVYRDGRFPRFPDHARAIAEAQRVANAIVDRAGLAHRLTPHWRQVPLTP